MAKQTKIVATIGPASEKKETLIEMVKAGVNVARFNFSHGTYEWHEKIMKRVREVGKKLDVPIAIMADLQGPRIRVGNVKPIKVKRGDFVYVVIKDKKGKTESREAEKTLIIYVPGINKYVRRGDKINIEDGTVELEVIDKKTSNTFIARVLNDGIIKHSKGINIPSISSKMGVITKKDEKDLAFILKQDVDYISLSFVGNDKDIARLKNKIKKGKAGRYLPKVVAKIEKEEAIKNFDKILKVTDAVMVARGDLGIEMEETKVPVFQKEIITKCLRSAKPVIVATQMLNSMINNPRPTRAEVSDVATAVVDHADAVMLSGETTAGKYPVKTVRVMSKIIDETEKSPFDDLPHGFLGDKVSSLSAAVADTTHELAKNAKAKAILAASISGFTACMVARHRPDQKMIVMTNNEKTYNQLALVWGVQSYILPSCKTLDSLIDTSIEEIKKRKILKKGDKIVIVTGRPHTKKEHMSLVKVQEIK